MTVRVQREKFRPYATATRETPLLHSILRPCIPFLLPVIATAYRCRWFLSLPLRTRILPKWIPTIPYFDWILNMTIGELLLLGPWIVVFILGYHSSFSVPDVDLSGFFASYTIVLTFFTANKANSLFSLAFGIPYERMVELHNLSSVVSIVLGLFHVITSYEYDQDSQYSALSDSKNWWRFLFDGATNRSGMVALTSMVLLVVLSFFRFIRHYAYQMWLFSHIVLALATLVGLLLHDVLIAIVIIAWWVLDLVVRYVYQSSFEYNIQASLRKIDTTDDHRDPAIEITFPKPFDFNAGQFVRIAVPALSVFEFHPITISSAPQEENVTLHVRALGNWTQRLVALGVDSTRVLMEGPYGAPSVDLDNDQQYQSVLLISGGIGVTPCQSIGKSLLHQHQILDRKLSKLKFVWVVRNLRMVQEIVPLGLLESVEELEDTLEVDVYCTRPGSEDNAMMERSTVPYQVHTGRPDMDEVFETMKAEALKRGESYVAVIACGPKQLIHSVQQACRRHSQAVVGCGGSGVFFDLHTERFEY